MDGDGSPEDMPRGVGAPQARGADAWEEDASHSAATLAEQARHEPSTAVGRQCTKCLPASSSAPKYKFVVPNEFVTKFMTDLIEKQFRMVDGQGGSWDMTLIQRKNKEKYEYMLQGWRRYGEEVNIQEGDTVVFEMVDPTTMLLTIVSRAMGPRSKAGRSKSDHGNGLAGEGPAMLGPGMGPQDLASLVHQSQQGGYGGVHLGHHGGGQPGLGGPRLGAPLHHGGGMGSQLAAAPPPPPLGMGMSGSGAHHGHHRMSPPLDYGGGYANGGGALPAHQLDYLPAGGHHYDKRARTGMEGMLGHVPGGGPGGPPPHGGMGPGPGAPGGGPPGSGIAMLSDVADLDLLLQENLLLQQELTNLRERVGMLENGVMNIKSVLTKTSDPGLIAMTGVTNLINQLEGSDLLPELNHSSRLALQRVCNEIKRHMEGVLRMVWILRSLPEDVQREHAAIMGLSPGMGMDGMPPKMD
ncbi:hypothetical protein ACKKBF_B12985 [Auxenochlorella protothecoides x Auxenochlorella symbiontica]